MSALPKAISHGSNGAGGGALTALTAISAARAEPESSASAVANNTVFFMTIPIVVRSVRLRRPQAQRQSTATNSERQSAARYRLREAKKTSNCCLFRRLAFSARCCAGVLHSDNNFCPNLRTKADSQQRKALRRQLESTLTDSVLAGRKRRPNKKGRSEGCGLG